MSSTLPSTTGTGSGNRDLVREQYEQFPYPPRDPREERTRLKRTYLDALEVINHYGFGGRRDMRQGLRALVAGGGTGDAAIHLAEQLRETPSRVVYVDISRTSMEIAQQRAAVRGLNNIEWHLASLVELPKLGVGPFDYIDCAGVLHHLTDPAAGLAALASVLAEDGVLGLMLYAKYGRTGVYQMQELLQLITANQHSAAERLSTTRRVLRTAPETNWYRKGAHLFVENDQSSDADLFDLLLHSQDRAYSVRDVHELLATSDLHLIEFNPELRARYRPRFTITDPELTALVRELPLAEQQAVSELMTGTITRHEFYAARRPDTAATIDCMENVLFFGLATASMGTKLSPDLWDLRFTQAFRLTTKPSPLAHQFVSLIDGQRTVGEIVTQLVQTGAATDAPTAFTNVCECYELLNLIDVLLLRHRDVPLYRPLQQRNVA